MGILNWLDRLRSRHHSSTIAPNQCDSHTVVIGAEFARAAEADRVWRSQRPPGHESPIGSEYDVWAGEMDLLRFSESELDPSINRLVSTYRVSPPDQRSKLRDRLSMGDCYALLTFARRSTVRAIRSQEPSVAVDGLVAVAMVDPQRVDRRDILQTVGLLYFALRRFGDEGASSVFREVATLSDSEVTSYIAAFPDQFGRDYKISDWGYLAVDTPEGLGLVEASIEPYDPTVDLLSAGLEIEAALDRDVYHASLTLRTALPGVWIGASADTPERPPAVDTIRACLTVTGRLRPDVGPPNGTQQMTVFVCETRHRDDAGRLAELATQTTASADHVGFAFTDGPLIAVVVARSWVEGTSSYETQASVERFREPFMAAVRSVL